MQNYPVVKELTGILLDSYLLQTFCPSSPSLVHTFGNLLGKFQSLKTLSLVSFAGMKLNKCAVLQIGDVKWRPPVQGNSPPVQNKEPYVNLDMVTCTCRLSSCNLECTKYMPAYIVLEGERQ